MSRSHRAAVAVALAFATSVAVGACGHTSVVVGDDSEPPSNDPDGSKLPDAPPVPPGDGSKPDSVAPDTGIDAPADRDCPVLSPPSPSFCDGGPIAAEYDSKGCVVGYACAPVSCSTAGGAGGGCAPGTCRSGHFGDATKYDCGGGLGVTCCLP